MISFVKQKRNVKQDEKKMLPKVLLRKFCLTNLFLFDKQNSQEDTFDSSLTLFVQQICFVKQNIPGVLRCETQKIR